MFFLDCIATASCNYFEHTLPLLFVIQRRPLYDLIGYYTICRRRGVNTTTVMDCKRKPVLWQLQTNLRQAR